MTSAAAAPYQPDLRIGHLFSRCWPLYKENLGLIIGSFAVYILVTGVLSASQLWGAMSGLMNILSIVIAGPMTVGLYGIMLRVLRGEPAQIGDLIDGFKVFGQAFGVYILMLVAIVVGFILLIVPGIIVLVGLWPALYLVYDHDLGVTETLQRAWDMTRGYKFQLFVLGLVLTLLMLAGLLALVVGLVFAGSYATLVGSAAYEELSLGHV